MHMSSILIYSTHKACQSDVLGSIKVRSYEPRRHHFRPGSKWPQSALYVKNKSACMLIHCL